MAPYPISVFIVDDDPIYLRFMTGHFAQLGGYQTEIFNTAQEAISALKTSRPEVIILDHHFAHDPDKTGLDHLKTIRKIRPKVPIIYLTGIQEEGLESKVMDLKVFRFIRKNDAFLVHLRSALDALKENPAKKSWWSQWWGD
jgi:two-component system, LytTR family, response regulator LytT